MKFTVCIGSSCHIKGSTQIRAWVSAELGDKVELGGTFCMNKCQQGVCVTVEDKLFSVSPESVAEFFEKQVLPNV